ncbi:MAG TPA: helix-turn-helix domain-containing protein [Trinickia sp.]|nr:helix-turn-helix domain-containing protein [Trinickia sp.]
MAKRIAILIFDGFSLVEVSSIAEVFRLANEMEIERASEAEPYTLVVFSSAGGGVASSCSMRVWSENLDAPLLTGFDALFIAGGPGAQQAKDDEHLVRRLRAMLQKTRVVKAIGEGAAILAVANLAHERSGVDFPSGAAFAARDSHAPLPGQSHALVAVEQPAALDDPLGPIAAALSVIKRDYGSAAAREISERSMPGAWRRLGAVLGDLDEGGAREKINAAARWIRENYGRQISVAEAAQVAAMSERSFLRRFKSQIGLTPSEYLLRARLDASCLLLVATDLPVDKIARRCGVGSGDGLAKIFRKRLSISPTEYRIAGRRRSDDG